MAQKFKRIRELLAYGWGYLRQEGLASTWKRGLGFVRRRLKSKRGRYLPTKQVLAAQRAFCAAPESKSWPKISVLVPLFNTPPKYLTQLLQSVQGQTYPNWELCLADASTTEAQAVEAVLKPWLQDPRIRVQRIENRDIATNTNAAAAMATGSWLALLDHDDILAPNALYEVAKAAVQQPCGFIYSDEALFYEDITRPSAGHFKPDYSPEYLLSCNYICHLAAFKKELYEAVGGERSECAGSQDHDLFLRLCERTGTAYHIPKVLYYWRVSASSTAGGVQAKPYVEQAAVRALNDHLQHTQTAAHAEKGKFPSTYHVVYDLPSCPLVSILIPNKDHTADLEKALESVYKLTDYSNFEVIVIENNSTDPATFAWYEQAKQRYKRLQVVTWQGPFNFSAINNFGRGFAKGEYLLLLNNDVEVLNGGWLRELTAQAAQPGIGAVGALLYYPDDRVQHAGVIVGLGGFAGHSHKYARRGASGYMFRQATVNNLSAVTGACLMVPAAVYDELGGLDEQFAVAYNDVDFCLRIRRAGYRIVFTPYAELYHYESISRGLDSKGAAKDRFAREQHLLEQRFGRQTLIRDPYYNPNLTLDSEDFAETAVFARD